MMNVVEPNKTVKNIDKTTDEKIAKKDIKIFVSHRIDQDAFVARNDIFYPVRCGAVYDNRTDIDIPGDNTGDNISKKRFSYCELTVQYWAWKNIEADYYGLCHYRRYLSFTDKKYPVGKEENNNGCVVESFLNEETMKKYGMSEDNMRRIIEDYDMIIIEPVDTMNKDNYTCMRDSYDYHNIADVDLMIAYIKREYPHMINAVDKYMWHVDKTYLYNCWIMNKELFNMFSEWQFEILSFIENSIDMSKYSQQKYRTPGTLGERLFGIFVTYIMSLKKYKIKSTQLVFFQETYRFKQLAPAFPLNNVAIVTNFNNAYTPIFSVFLLSALMHMSKDKNYDFVVISQDMTDDNKKKLQTLCARQENVSLRFIKAKHFFSDVKLHVDASNFYTEDMYYRVIMPHILENYDKIVALDVDTVIKEDIAALFETNLNGNIAAAVSDVVYQGYLNGFLRDMLDYASKTLKLKNPYSYCNTGIILMDAKAYREKYSLDFLIEHINKHHFRIYEQDTLNVLLQDEMIHLDRAWNTFSFTNPQIEKSISFAPFRDKEEYYECRKSPKIIHYAGQPKPWTTIYGDFADDFWGIARLSPYYEQILGISMNYIIYHANINKFTNKHRDQKLSWRVINKFLPNGSRRREVVKRIACLFTGRKYVKSDGYPRKSKIKNNSV